jgi:hypothetical protein
MKMPSNGGKRAINQVHVDWGGMTISIKLFFIGGENFFLYVSPLFKCLILFFHKHLQISYNGG